MMHWVILHVSDGDMLTVKLENSYLFARYDSFNKHGAAQELWVSFFSSLKHA